MSNFIEGFRRFRFHLRRLWKLPHDFRASPALCGVILLTCASLGVTLTSWAFTRLLPQMELIRGIAKDFPRGGWKLLGRLPQLLAAAPGSSEALTGVLVSQEPYILTYACGAVTVFCFVLLVVALLRKW